MTYLDKAGAQKVIEVIKAYADSKKTSSKPENILDFYPVGTVLIAANADYDPNVAIGGEWGQIADKTTTAVWDSDSNKYKRTWYDDMSGEEAEFFFQTRGADSTGNLDAFSAYTRDMVASNWPAHTHTTTEAIRLPGTNTSDQLQYSGSGTTGFKFDSSSSWGFTTTAVGNGAHHRFFHTPEFFAVNVWRRNA